MLTRQKSSLWIAGVSPQLPPTLPDIHQVTQIKILEVTVTNHLRLRILKRRCSRHYLRVRPIYVRTQSSPQSRYVRRRIERRSAGEVAPRLSSLVAVCHNLRQADEGLFRRTIYSEHHVLKQFLPDSNNCHYMYSLRHRRHNFTLATKTGERNFITI